MPIGPTNPNLLVIFSGHFRTYCQEYSENNTNHNHYPGKQEKVTPGHRFTEQEHRQRIKDNKGADGNGFRLDDSNLVFTELHTSNYVCNPNEERSQGLVGPCRLADPREVFHMK